ncbi:MAG: HU family DNA-binding protein [Alphaproteobacteria bacterium]|nr:HU family DNA-binding protein [Alphaproteobacteria bacterium]MDH5557771.1 HU family DNA-binding protein [Alphaproteobacteria bacterium]
MNKNDLISSVAADSGLSKADATKAVDAVFDSIEKSLKSGNEVRLVGFGTFSVADRKASTGRNPRTGETIQIPASKQPKFKAGKGLKDAVN